MDGCVRSIVIVLISVVGVGRGAFHGQLEALQDEDAGPATQTPSVQVVTTVVSNVPQDWEIGVQGLVWRQVMVPEGLQLLFILQVDQLGPQYAIYELHAHPDVVDEEVVTIGVGGGVSVVGVSILLTSIVEPFAQAMPTLVLLKWESIISCHGVHCPTPIHVCVTLLAQFMSVVAFVETLMTVVTKASVVSVQSWSAAIIELVHAALIFIIFHPCIKVAVPSEFTPYCTSP